MFRSLESKCVCFHFINCTILNRGHVGHHCCIFLSEQNSFFIFFLTVLQSISLQKLLLTVLQYRAKLTEIIFIGDFPPKQTKDQNTRLPDQHYTNMYMKHIVMSILGRRDKQTSDHQSSCPAGYPKEATCGGVVRSRTCLHRWLSRSSV